MKRLLLVDTLNSAFYLKHSKEQDVVWRFIIDIRDIAARFKIDRVVFAHEGGSSNYRNEIYPAYKWKRKEIREKSTPAEKKEFTTFVKKVDDLVRIAPMFGIRTINVRGAEADDVYAFIVNNIDLTEWQVLGLSTDTDLNQTLRENVVQGSYGKEMALGIRTGKIPASIFKNHKEFEKESNLTPVKYTQAKCLSGDTSDSIEGFIGVGEKIAQALIEKYGDFENIKANLDTLKVPRLMSKSVDQMRTDFDRITELNYKLVNLNWDRATYQLILGKDGVDKLDAFLMGLSDPVTVDKKAIEELCYENGRIDIVDKMDFFLHPFVGRC